MQSCRCSGKEGGLPGGGEAEGQGKAPELREEHALEPGTALAPMSLSLEKVQEETWTAGGESGWGGLSNGPPGSLCLAE